MTTLQVKTRVLPGGRIEVQVPDLLEGTEATVQITVDETPPPKKKSFLENLGGYKGGQSFKTVEEVDDYIHEERNSWDR